jgi:hypothetical protein
MIQVPLEIAYQTMTALNIYHPGHGAAGTWLQLDSPGAVHSNESFSRKNRMSPHRDVIEAATSPNHQQTSLSFSIQSIT